MAINDVSFSLPAGEIRAIIGPNGAGKTTFFNLVTGVFKPTAGEVFFKGEDITDLPSYKRVKLGIGRSFQVVNLFPDLSVEKNLHIAVQASLKRKSNPFESVNRDEIHNRADELLAKYHWIQDPHMSAGALIYPEQKKLETLMALVQEPELILLDEPTAGVDENDIGLISEMIGDVSQNCTILLTDHDIKFVLKMAHKITVLNSGCIIAEGTPSYVAQDPKVDEVYYGGALQ
jgi:branched-chain amino acid transport system ATP-binding protein